MAYYHSAYSSGSRRKKSRFGRVIILILLLLILIGLGLAYQLWVVIFKPNTWVSEGNEQAIYIRTGSSYEEMKSVLYSNGLVINRKTFEWLAAKKNLHNNVHPGKYMIRAGLNNNELINLLRSGNQTPILLVFNNVRTKQELAMIVGEQIEADSAEIMDLLNDSSYLKILGFTGENVLSLFIPNTYEVYWTMTAREFTDRMLIEYNKFWNADRLARADQINLTPVEISILASIVDKETVKTDEMPAIAGVYLNRLKYGWRLQADPTIVYAWGDFSIRRVLNIHKMIESPYNTYLNYGLPPGPICLPSIAAIEAVLNRENHGYMYFCARDDFSGYHVFASTNEQHVINANRYRQALDQLKIKN